jgi:hypothetical protein
MAIFPQRTPVLFDRALHLGSDRMSQGGLLFFSQPFGFLVARFP